MIPAFTPSGVLPFRIGDIRSLSSFAPFRTTSEELVRVFGASSHRKSLLLGFFQLREVLRSEGLTGIQWVDGSFSEDIESTKKRDPNDVDVLTIYTHPNINIEMDIQRRRAEFASTTALKAAFHVDHYFLSLSMDPLALVWFTRYWFGLFTHNRDGMCKGMLAVDLNTPQEDRRALHLLSGGAP